MFAPAPILTVAIESRRGGGAEIHLHPGGQGFWIARLMAELGVDVTLCATFGGETGHVVLSLLERERLVVRGVRTKESNGGYVHDRRDGRRTTIADMRPGSLSRHEVDELYGATLVESLGADVCVLGGPGLDPMLPPDVYGRLAADMSSNGVTVVADLAGEPLDACGEHVAVLKVSDEELLQDGRVASLDPEAILPAIDELASGGRAVVCSRAEQPALASFAGRRLAVRGPVMRPMDSSGAGDSLTAGIATGLARHEPFETALKLGAAAGALNVTRRGLGTGRRRDIEELAARIEIRDLEAG